MEQLAALYHYLAAEAGSSIAERYTSAVVDHCESLQVFPHRAAERADIRPGLRITNHRGRTIIAFAVDETARRVSIVGIFHGGQNYETALRPEFDD
jgi:plasmid stabilization system protein ParE